MPVAVGAAGGLAGDLTAQSLQVGMGMRDHFDLGEALLSGLGGAVGGAASWRMTNGLLHRAGADAGKALCEVPRAVFVGRHVAGGVIGAAAGDAIEQGGLALSAAARGESYQWDFSRTLQSVALAAATSAASSSAQWKHHRACFVAGTPLLTTEGSKPIQDIKEGDYVLSRDEGDPTGPVVPKVVEEVFVRTGRVVWLRVEGREIGTTAEHPFFCVLLWKWLPAGELREGEFILGLDGRLLRVEGLRDDGEYATVYNLRVDDFHTYFVGCEAWGFSVWAHNAAYRSLNDEDIAALNAGEPIKAGGTRRGLKAIADLIDNSARDTQFIPTTESKKIRMFDHNNHVEFDETQTRYMSCKRFSTTRL